MKARDYQLETFGRTLEALASPCSSALVVWATGLGKTILVAMLADWFYHQRMNTLILAHRKILVDQAARKYFEVSGRQPMIEMNCQHASRTNLFHQGGVVVGSLQTMKGKRLACWSPDAFDLIVIDEAHHAPCNSYGTIRNHFSRSRCLGITATPDMGEKRHLIGSTRPFSQCLSDLSLPWAIQAGWLVPIRQKFVHVDGVDLSRIDTGSRDDFTDEEIATVMDQDRAVYRVVKPTLENDEGKSILFFCASVPHARHVSEVANAVKKSRDCCAYVASYELAADGKRLTADPLRRQREEEAYRDGNRQALANYAIYGEGADFPRTTIISNSRLTKKRYIVAQQVGRATRPFPGGLVDQEHLDTPEKRRQAIAESTKPFALVYDYVGNSGKHRLVHALDCLLPDNTPEAVRDIAIRIIEKKGETDGFDPEAAFLEARTYLKDQEARNAAIRDRIAAKVAYQMQDVEGFAADMTPEVHVEAEKPGRATDKQIRYINRLCRGKYSWDLVAQLSWKQAGILIDHLRDCQDRNLPIPMNMAQAKRQIFDRKKRSRAAS